MLEKLENLFQTAFTTEFNPSDKNRFWFKTEDGRKFGILKTALSNGEINLLMTLFLPIESLTNERKNSGIQQKWHVFLFENSKEIPFSEYLKEIRFFYFFLTQPIEDLTNFKEAISGGFQQPVILMLSNTHGIIIDEKPQVIFDKETFNQLSDTLTSDFLVEIYSYIGQLHKVDLLLKDKFDYEYKFFKSLHQDAGQEKTFTFYEAFPFLLVDSPSYVEKGILSSLFIESIQGLEMIHTIQVFLQCNLNVSLAAKKLYIHRNSLQYRLDKFIENTGIDIRSFANATFVSLAILLMSKESH